MRKLSDWHLQLFAGEAAAEGAATGEAEQAEAGAAVQQGTETQAAAEQQTPAQSFEELINGPYKQEFGDRVQGIINNRFRESKVMEAELAKSKAINAVLSAKYKIDPNNTDALLVAVQGDESYYAEAAYENGMSVEAYKQKLKGDRAIAELADIRKNERKQQLLNHFKNESNKVRQQFGDESFDFQQAYAENEDFKSIIDAGGTVERAYKFMNMDKIAAQERQQAADAARRAVANDIMANGQRPVEGGMRSQPPVSTQIDVNNLTDQQMDELIAQARSGRPVTFR